VTSTETRRTVNFEFDEEQERLRDSLRRYLADRAPITDYLRAGYGTTRGKDGVWNGLAELGAVGVIGPVTHGGAGATFVDAAVVLEECGRALYPGPVLASGIAAISVARTDVGEASDATLRALCDGTRIGAVALFEPHVPADWRAVTTVADERGGVPYLSGAKGYVLGAPDADVFFVTARDPGGAVAWFVAESAAPGIVVVPIDLVDGSRPCAHVNLDEVPARRIGGEVGDAEVIIADVLDRMRVALVVDAVGAAARALELTIAYAKDRFAFGSPIGSFQAIQHLCADMLRAVELARAASYYASWAVDAAPPAESHRAATMAAAFATGELARVGESAIQVFGGIGFTWEHDVHLFFKRLLSASALLGTADDHLMTLADLVFDVAQDSTTARRTTSIPPA